jgi:purine-binding chemotaxis protein CheW
MSMQQHDAAVAGVVGAADGEDKLLSFGLGHETFAVPVARVKEIIEYDGVTRVPMTPACFRGVLNLRGSVVPVIDLSVRLGRSAAATGRRTCIVVLELGDEEEPMDVGVVVDSVSDVFDIRAGDMQGAPSFGATVPGEFIAGMVKLRERFIVVLDEMTTLAPDALAELVTHADG